MLITAFKTRAEATTALVCRRNFATFLWALSGAIVGMHKRYDFAGVVVIALLAAMGGSTLRDGFFLHRQPPVVTDIGYLPLIVLAAIVVRFFRQRIAGMRLVDNLINLIDALGVPAFAVVGMQLSLDAGLAAPGVVLIGRFNLSAGFLACVLFVVWEVYLHVSTSVAAWIIIGLFFTIRALSVHYDWQTQPVLPPVEKP